MLTVAERSNEELIALAKEGSEEAMEQLITNNEGLVKKAIGKYSKDPYVAEELKQIANIAIMTGAYKFDEKKGYKASTYLMFYIRGSILNHFRDNRYFKSAREESALSVKIKKNGLRDASAREISEALGVDEQLAYNTLIFMQQEIPKGMSEVVHKSNRGRVGDDVTIGDTLVSENEEELIDNRIQLEQYIKQLPTKEGYIINQRFFCDRKQQDIGNELGISYQEVGRLEKRAVKHLKELMEGKEIKEGVQGRKGGFGKGNQELAMKLLREGKHTFKQMEQLSGVPYGTISYWKRQNKHKNK
ncbi:RNA polymerase, SigF-like [Bacillus phage Troll]|uniref:SigF-like RNA polymerase n=4 Tax=Caudoviricetes TaxID=2731619 RepID=A0A075LZW9_9CAUD|nr:RNA polymerase sigma factor [Bacillus phage Troll]YP_009055966.1 RNA polymerase sigma factor [Bacillus phage Riley]AGT13480.1 RNA polymerase, SigF-like [Bacillus phage Troll]AIF72077.1 sigF-like RNA polymerase [Bacillus phage Riley]ASZ75934.1 SigF-like RNA polymerase sigma factor [Bacillus phage Taffo16]